MGGASKGNLGLRIRRTGGTLTAVWSTEMERLQPTDIHIQLQKQGSQTTIWHPPLRRFSKSGPRHWRTLSRLLPKVPQTALNDDINQSGCYRVERRKKILHACVVRAMSCYTRGQGYPSRSSRRHLKNKPEPFAESTTQRSSIWRHTDDMRAKDPVCLLDQERDLALGIQIRLGP